MIIIIGFILCCQINKKILLRDLDIASLDMSGVIMPSQFICNGETYKLSWDYSEPIDQQFYISTYLSSVSNDAKAFIWQGKKDEGIVYFTVADFDYPLVAKILYPLLDPSRIFATDYENFQRKDSNMTPTNWKLNNYGADNDGVKCGLGNQEKCYGWFYQARYSQYMLLITDYGPYCSEGFASIIQPIIEHFVGFLEN
jgi:hypothetical protein